MKELGAKAMIFTAPGKIDIETVAVRPSDGTVVRSELIGISHGTEMLFYRGTIPEGIEADDTLAALGGELAYPIRYGYMNVGRTEDGERVFAFYPHQDIFTSKQEELFTLSRDTRPEDGIFLASMETALSIVQDLRPVAGEAILIIGQGTVGLLVAEILKLCGLYTVITADCYSLRRRVSTELGCLCIDPDTVNAAGVISGATRGRGVDRAVNLSASERGLQLAVDSLAFEGEVIEASWYGSREVALSLGRAFHRKRLTIRSSQVSHIAAGMSSRWDKTRRLGLAAELINRIRPSKYITHTFPLDKAGKAFELLSSTPEETIQIVLKPGVE